MRPVLWCDQLSALRTPGLSMGPSPSPAEPTSLPGDLPLLRPPSFTSFFPRKACQYDSCPRAPASKGPNIRWETLLFWRPRGTQSRGGYLEHLPRVFLARSRFLPLDVPVEGIRGNLGLPASCSASAQGTVPCDLGLPPLQGQHPSYAHLT